MDEINNTPNISEAWIKEDIKYSSNDCPVRGAMRGESKDKEHITWREQGLINGF